MWAWKKTGNDGADYKEAARNAALEMRDAITAITSIQD
jgi:orotidine-5'-phosphate decarboxylase